MVPKFENCKSCYFKDREPAICESCHRESNYEAVDADPDAFEQLSGIEFYDKWSDA